MLENKNSEAGFIEQSDLEYLRKEEEKKIQEQEKLKKENPIARHKQKIEAMENQSAELEVYVQQHFDLQRQLLNHKGEKGCCYNGCYDNQHVLSQAKWQNMYVQCWMLYALYFGDSVIT